MRPWAQAKPWAVSGAALVALGTGIVLCAQAPALALILLVVGVLLLESRVKHTLRKSRVKHTLPAPTPLSTAPALAMRDQLVLAEALNLLDHLDQAAAGLGVLADPAAQACAQGVQLAVHEFVRRLATFEVQVFTPTVGAPFDPRFEEAVRTIVGSNATPGTIVEVHSRGCLIAGGPLVRPARVAVSAPSPPGR